MELPGQQTQQTSKLQAQQEIDSGFHVNAHVYTHTHTHVHTYMHNVSKTVAELWETVTEQELVFVKGCSS